MPLPADTVQAHCGHFADMSGALNGNMRVIATGVIKEISMRKLMLPLAVIGLAALTGCVGYGGGVYGSGAYYDGSPYYGSAPYYGSPYYSPYYGSPYYGSGVGVGVVIEQRPAYVYGNRRDRDRDGVPNWRDAYPSDPRRH